MQHHERFVGNAPVVAAPRARGGRFVEERAVHPERNHVDAPVVSQPGGQLVLQPLRAHHVGVRMTQRLEGGAQEPVAHALAPAVGGGAQHDHRHEIVHGDDRGAVLGARHHVRVGVVEDVDQIGAARLAPQPPGIEIVPGRVTLRAEQRSGKDEPGGIDRLGPPPDEPPRPPAVARLARQLADMGRESHLEAAVLALEPVVQAVGVLVHRGPALERQIGD